MILYILIAFPFKFIIKHPFSHLTKNRRSELSSYRVSIKAMSVDSSSSITLSIYLFGWLEKLATILFISFNINLPFRVVTLLMYIRDSSARSVFLSFVNWTIYRYHSCRTPNICFSLENTGNENFKKSFHTFFHLSRQSGVSHTFDNLKIHRTIIIALVSNRLFLLSFLIFRRQSYGVG